jgi:hypothetical protein
MNRTSRGQGREAPARVERAARPQHFGRRTVFWSPTVQLLPLSRGLATPEGALAVTASIRICRRNTTPRIRGPTCRPRVGHRPASDNVLVGGEKLAAEDVILGSTETKEVTPCCSRSEPQDWCPRLLSLSVASTVPALEHGRSPPVHVSQVRQPGARDGRVNHAHRRDRSERG